MNTRQIDNILRSDLYALPVFRGVFARHKESVGLQLLSGVWIRVKTLVCIGWWSILIRAGAVTILTATACHLRAKNFKTF